MTLALDPRREREGPPPAASSFALREGPAPGESIDSYVHWAARQLHCSPSDMVDHLGLGTPTSAGYLNRDLSDEHLAHAAHRIGHTVEDLRQTTLVRWAWLALHPERGKRGSPLGAWQRGSGARYCPDCLIANGGRWKLSWYLHWSFACVEHAVLLESLCRRCGKAPRTQKPGTLALSPVDRHALNCGCHGQIARAPESARLAPDDERLATQRHLDVLLTTPPTADAICATGGNPVTALEWVTDLTMVTHFVMLSLQGADAFTACRAGYDLADLPPPTAWSQRLPLRQPPVEMSSEPCTLTPQKLQRELVKSSADIASCVTLADTLLASDDIDHLAAGLLWVERDWRVKFQQRAARGQFACSQPLSDAMTGGVRQASDGWYNSLRTRHRPRPQLSDDPTRYFPATLYPEVRRRVRAIRGDLREAAVIVGLLAGRRDARHVRDTASEMGLAHVAADLAETWMQLSRTPAARYDIRTVASWLFLHHYQVEPIDFGSRRSHLPQPTPLPVTVTRSLASAIGTRHSPTLQRVAALYVWERLTGSDALLTPATLNAYGAFRGRYRHVRTRWNHCLPLALHHHLNNYALLETPAGTTAGVSPAERRCSPVHPSVHWTSSSHAEPHLLTTMLQPRPDLLVDDLVGRGAVQLAQAIAGNPDAPAWSGIRLLWRFNVRALRNMPAPLLDQARNDLAALTTGQSAERPPGGADRWDRLLEDVLMILRTDTVPHTCHHAIAPLIEAPATALIEQAR